MNAVSANLLAMIFLPLAGGLLLLFVKWPAAIVRQISLGITSLTLVLSIILVGQFQGVSAPKPDPKSPIHPRIELKHEWMTYVRHVTPEQSTSVQVQGRPSAILPREWTASACRWWC